MTKADFEKWKSIGVFKKTDCEVVEDTVNQLIDNLYKPCEDERMADGIDFVADQEKLKRFEIDGEAINWGDLKACEVKKFDDGQFLVVVDEAAPGCINLIRYIERFMKQFGWNVRVETEW